MQWKADGVEVRSVAGVTGSSLAAALAPWVAKEISVLLHVGAVVTVAGQDEVRAHKGHSDGGETVQLHPEDVKALYALCAGAGRKRVYLFTTRTDFEASAHTTGETLRFDLWAGEGRKHRVSDKALTAERPECTHRCREGKHCGGCGCGGCGYQESAPERAEDAGHASVAAIEAAMAAGERNTFRLRDGRSYRLRQPESAPDGDDPDARRLLVAVAGGEDAYRALAPESASAGARAQMDRLAEYTQRQAWGGRHGLMWDAWLGFGHLAPETLASAIAADYEAARAEDEHRDLHTDPDSGATCAPNCPWYVATESAPDKTHVEIHVFHYIAHSVTVDLWINPASMAPPTAPHDVMADGSTYMRDIRWHATREQADSYAAGYVADLPGRYFTCHVITHDRTVHDFAAPESAPDQECGYCGDAAVKADFGYVHATDGDRVTVSPGDMVSARHNRAGTPILAVDLVDAAQSAPEGHRIGARVRVADVNAVGAGSVGVTGTVEKITEGWRYWLRLDSGAPDELESAPYATGQAIGTVYGPATVDSSHGDRLYVTQADGTQRGVLRSEAWLPETEAAPENVPEGVRVVDGLPGLEEIRQAINALPTAPDTEPDWWAQSGSISEIDARRAAWAAEHAPESAPGWRTTATTGPNPRPVRVWHEPRQPESADVLGLTLAVNLRIDLAAWAEDYGMAVEESAEKAESDAVQYILHEFTSAKWNGFVKHVDCNGFTMDSEGVITEEGWNS